MLASLLPAGMAAFDQCARSSGTWVGFDQGIGRTNAQAVTHSGTNVYVGGYASGALSFGSRHADGKYHDHMGHNQVHDTISDVTIHHETASVSATAGTRNTDRLSSQLGQDSFIYKLSDAGMPVSVYAMDTMPSDGDINGTSRNGGWGGWSYIYGLDDFDLSGETDQIAAVGMIRGSIKFPKAGEDPVELLNIKNSKYDPWVAKIDMAAGGSVVWATKAGIELRESPVGCMKDGDDLGDGVKCVQNSAYPVSVVTTLAGHVITTTRTYIKRKYAGVMSKFNGLTGALVWSNTFGDGLYQRYGKMSVSGETAYMTARFKGKDSADLLAASSCEDGTEDSVVVAAFDVSPSDAPKASWVTVIGCGNREGGSFVEGDYIYASGRLSAASTLTPADGVAAAACTMAGDLGGFLVKLNKADGKCVWAKDLGSSGVYRIAANAEYVWIAVSSSSDFKFDADHVLKPAGDDAIMGKFSATDGAGLWGDLIGAEGDDWVYDMAMTLQGPVVVGSSSSSAVAVGAVTAENLQQTDKATNEGPGKTAMFAIQTSMTDTLPSCIAACPSGELTAATTVIAANNCYIEGVCLAHDAPSPRLPCFKCDANTDQRALPALPILTEHCYFDDKCHAKGAAAPRYVRYGSSSVCETCEPDVDPNAWTLTSGFFHDRNTASQRNAGANDYGIYFTSRSNGCQLLPSMPMPNAPTASLNTANANPTVRTVAGIGARATRAISAVTGAAKGNQGAETAWAWYLGDSTKCIKSGDVCNDTPSELSDAMAMHFETNLHYGHSIARVKVQQVLAILQSDLGTPSAARSIADLKMDIVAHMLIPHYQGAIHAANEIDIDSNVAKAKADGAEHWKVIDAAVTSFSASDRAQLTAMFSPAASGKMNFCTVQALLLRNLPGGSNLQYGSNDCIKEGCKEIGTHLPEDDDAQHVTAEDIGVLKVSRQADGTAKDCSVLAMPPPASPPLIAEIGTETIVTTFTAAGTVSDYADTTALQEKFATAAGVDKKMVSITVIAASVIITVTITVPKDKVGATLQASIASAIGQTKAEQSKALGITVEKVTVTTVQDSKDSADSDSGLTEGEIAGVAIGAAIGGILLLGIVGLILRSLMFKEAKPVFTCLEKAPAAKTDKSPA
jgi:hypothetical protein